ncbi:hypothetical protein B0H16DRAFT_350769 [Mycena metata]|uniref:Uncharacterized protein n=1 Tax=Mycena metata TaxID=1033252 RepID=A0AAD7JMB9_9AGAR|nr:hypothetical protein B0H16DRAFT_350769 [Mycena metata]
MMNTGHWQHGQTQPGDDFKAFGIETSKYGGAFFPESKEFTISGGVFNNITNYHGSFPSDFRLIPLGDIDLQHEIPTGAAIVERPRERRCVRRVYSAKLEGRSSGMTVALYQGDNAEEEWRSAISPLSSVRYHRQTPLLLHPNCGRAGIRILSNYMAL